MDSGILSEGALGIGQIGSRGSVHSALRGQVVERGCTAWIRRLRESGKSKG